MTAAVALPSWIEERPLARLLAPFALLHAAMLAYDMQHPERFFYADRAGDRLVSMDRWLREGADMLAARGVIGDWLPHAILYLAGGMLLVIVVQVALALASIACVRALGTRLGLDEGKASLAAALYGLLPHTLVYPHQLASEAIFVPLVIFAFTFTSGLAMGLAIVVRPVVALWPLAHWKNRRYLFLALAPLLLWACFIRWDTGEWGIGRSHADLGANLYQRAVRMTAHLPPGERVEGRGSMGALEYLRFAAAHPREAATHHARDLATLGFKSGIERIVLDYLDLFPQQRAGLQKSGSGWRKQLELHGPAAALQALIAQNGLLVAASLLGALLFAALMALALAGALTRSRDPQLRWLLAGFVVYVFATAQAVDAAASRHRAPAEFAICLLAVLALARRPNGSKRHGG